MCVCVCVFIYFSFFTVVTVRANAARMHSDLFYYADNCSTSLDVIKENFITRMNSNAILQDACVGVPTCVVENVQVNSASPLDDYLNGIVSLYGIHVLSTVGTLNILLLLLFVSVSCLLLVSTFPLVLHRTCSLFIRRYPCTFRVLFPDTEGNDVDTAAKRWCLIWLNYPPPASRPTNTESDRALEYRVYKNSDRKKLQTRTLARTHIDTYTH